MLYNNKTEISFSKRRRSKSDPEPVNALYEVLIKKSVPMVRPTVWHHEALPSDSVLLHKYQCHTI